MPYIPNTDEDRQAMLKEIGVDTFEALISNIPESLKFKDKLHLPAAMSELEITNHLQSLARKNSSCDDFISYLGGGAYDHFIPAAIDHIVSRSEFYTAYTPYQPEVSQGTLQVIYEYQSLITELMQMEVANASMYDGSSALAEACLMAMASTKRKKIILPRTIHPNYRRVVDTYMKGQNVEVVILDTPNGITEPDMLANVIDDKTAAVAIQHPNFFGCLEPVTELEPIIHSHGSLFISSSDPISLGILDPPGNYGVDIATAEGQCFGNPVYFGGPYLGILSTREKYIRSMPGRIAGMTTDKNGRDGFVLTFQTREQHIRREKATSNICSNQALNALTATVYLALLGKQGIIDVATHCIQKSHYLAEKLTEIPDLELRYSHPFFKEFLITTPMDASKIVSTFANENIQAGIPCDQFDYDLPNSLLIAVTEKRSKAEMDMYLDIMTSILRAG